jgi:hypothetical protein
MNTGNSQILGYSVEPAFGTETAPAASLGIVTGGSIRESAKIYKFYGTESKWLVNQQYGNVDCGGRCSLIVQDLSILEWGAYRNGALGELSSCTLDAGVSVSASILPRRMIGSKVSDMRVLFKIDSVLTADLTWISQQVKAGAAAGYSPATGGIWVPEGIRVLLGGVELYDIQSVEIAVNNNLTPKFYANNQTANPRACSRIAEGVQTITAKLGAWERISPGVRTGALTHNALGVTLQILLRDVTDAGNTGEINLYNCFIPGVEEPLAPVQIIEYGYELSASTIELI